MQQQMAREGDGLVLYRGKIYVPHDSQLRLNIVKDHHNYPLLATPAGGKQQSLSPIYATA